MSHLQVLKIVLTHALSQCKRHAFSATAVLLLCVVGTSLQAKADTAYGAGTYGACTFSTCGISLTSSGTVNVNVIPGVSTTCTVQSDSVAVTTDSSTGYTLTFQDNAGSSTMSGSNGGSITPVSGTNVAPVTLSANKWGYRVDGAGGFGAGPTSTSSNGGIPSVTFAAVPNSGASPDTLVSSGSAADPAVTTLVWYGLCANTTIPNGTYSSGVTYTGVVN